MLALITVKGGFGLAAGVLALIPVFGVDVFHGRRHRRRRADGGPGVGALVGPFFGHRLAGPSTDGCSARSAWRSAVFGLSYMALGLAPTLWVAAIVIFVAHLGGGAQWVLSTYGLQVLVPDRIRGRIFAFDFALITLSLGLSSLAASAIADCGGTPSSACRAGRDRLRLGGRLVGAHAPASAAARSRGVRRPDQDLDGQAEPEAVALGDR